MVGSSITMTSVTLRRRDQDHREAQEESHGKAETGEMEHLGPPEAGRGKKDLALKVSEGAQPCQHFDFRL